MCVYFGNNTVGLHRVHCKWWENVAYLTVQFTLVKMDSRYFLQKMAYGYYMLWTYDTDIIHWERQLFFFSKSLFFSFKIVNYPEKAEEGYFVFN